MTAEVVNRGPNASQPAKLRFSGGTLSYLDIPALQSGESTTFEDNVVILDDIKLVGVRP